MSQLAYSASSMMLLFRGAVRGQIVPQPELPYAAELDGLLRLTNIWYYSLDLCHGTFRCLSPGVNRLLGYDRRQWLVGGTRCLFEALCADDLPQLRSIHQRMLEEIRAVAASERESLGFTYTYRMRTQDGRTLHLATSTTFLSYAPCGAPLSDLNIVTDITPLGIAPPCRFWMYRHVNGVYHTYATKALGVEICVHFTPRELEVLRFIAEGCSSHEIAAQLHISYHTVCSHRKNLLRKAEVGTTVELLNYAQRHGLIGIV